MHKISIPVCYSYLIFCTDILSPYYVIYILYTYFKYIIFISIKFNHIAVEFIQPCGTRNCTAATAAVKDLFLPIVIYIARGNYSYVYFNLITAKNRPKHA